MTKGDRKLVRDLLITAGRSPAGLSDLLSRAADKIEGLESDLFLAVEVAFKRGAVEWTRLNYPEYYARLTGEKS